MGERHYEDEDFPESCDHCPAELGPGASYRRVLLVMDASSSVVPSPGRQAVRATLEDSYELVLCVSCAERLGLWLRTPLAVELSDGEVAEELDDGALAAELEKELYVLSHDPEPRSPNGVDEEGE